MELVLAKKRALDFLLEQVDSKVSAVLRFQKKKNCLVREVSYDFRELTFEENVQD